MKIVIDARLYSQSGVGRYTQKLISNLTSLDKKTKYLVFLNKDNFFAFKPPAKNFEKRLVNIPWHSLAEQIFLPLYLIKEKPDLVHFPYFSVPIFYPGKFIVTIHDLTIDHFDTGRASTRNLFVYKFKRLFYKFVMKKALGKAQKVIAVSQTTKKEITDHYKIDPQKIVVTYEAAEFKPLKRLTQKPLISCPYILYVGNAYPHKNLERLAEAFYLLRKHFSQLKLVLVGKEDFFYKRLGKNLSGRQKKDIIFFGFANDRQLINLYRYARAFVFPSLMEGFGLPPLEAMYFGCPVVASNTSSIPEICGQAALYFNSESQDDMADKIRKVIENFPARSDLIKKGFQQVKKYSWQKMARQTLEIYKSIR